MTRTLLALAMLAMAITLSACPRKAAEDTAANSSSMTMSEDKLPPADSAPESEVTDGEAANPCATALEGETAANPCNPCATPTDDAAAANPCNPCAKAEEAPAEVKPAAATTKVVLETTKGNIVLEVHPEWAPIGAAHFLELVNAKYYDGAPWFRVIDGFVAQCGIAADPVMTAKWQNKTIMDDPVVQGNKPGYVAFGKTGAPNSRSTHIFINYADNSMSLDPQGFACFAQVVEGMDVANKLFRAEFADQAALSAPGGLDAFRKMFPEADYIKKAYVRK